MTTPLKFFAGTAVLAAASASVYAFLNGNAAPEVVFNAPPTSSSAASVAASSEPEAVSSAAASENPAPTPPTEKPGSVRLTMPFASQAPLGNWDPPYDEACEEASLIIVRHYLEGTPLDASIMNTEILAMVEHEELQGLPIDIDMNQLADVATDMFGYQTKVITGEGVTIDVIEQELAKGNAVIAPFAGRDLGNPYYSGDGPPYHVLVIVGYDGNNFITHDVGTKRGANYAYDKDVVMSAIHDWVGSVDTIRSGPKRILVVTK